MEGMDSPFAKAYIAPENFEEPVRYSGHVEQPDGSLEFSPIFASILEAVNWARERTGFVIAREVEGDYMWFGIGPPPAGVEPPRE